MNTAKLFNECLSEVPEDLKKQVDLSFAISDKIDSILKERGMSRQEFASVMGKNKSEISKWLCGTHNFTIGTLAKISTALGCDLISI